MTRANTITDPDELLSGWRWERARGKALLRWGRTDLADTAFALADDYDRRLKALGVDVSSADFWLEGSNG